MEMHFVTFGMFFIIMWCLEITGHCLTLPWSSDLPGQTRVASLSNLHLTFSQFTALPHICSFDINCHGDTSSVPAKVAFSFHQSFSTPLLHTCPHWSMLPLFPKGYITSLLIVKRKEFAVRSWTLLSWGCGIDELMVL